MGVLPLIPKAAALCSKKSVAQQGLINTKSRKETKEMLYSVIPHVLMS